MLIKRENQYTVTLRNVKAGEVFTFNNNTYLMIKRYPDIAPYNVVDLESGEPEQLALNVEVVLYKSASVELNEATPVYEPVVTN